MKKNKHPLTKNVKAIAIDQLVLLYTERDYKTPLTNAKDTIDAYNSCTMSIEQQKDIDTINKRMLENA